ncbi:response regulator [Phragmitibacter flavus]|uniref:Response regulator n=1 Tax=Phragmitibacter flavus TaxID=2576071 RepID=A0A5R8KGD9_9BACT|nr:response regulator [Phragmitibacter flavus]TLD71377.1 response regulator [Phragmitibacter flavus]
MQPESELMNLTPANTQAEVLSIFLVEDDPDTARVLGRYLRHLGHHVQQACCMKDALAALPVNQLDVWISDIGLPDGTGWQLLRRARLPASVYPIAISGFGTANDLSQSKQAGFQRHLIKPFHIQELNEILMGVARARPAGHSETSEVLCGGRVERAVYPIGPADDDDRMDEATAESFPASDPPSWCSGRDRSQRRVD